MRREAQLAASAQRWDITGVHLSYDSMASVLTPYGSAAALAIAKDIDLKIESLLEMAA